MFYDESPGGTVAVIEQATVMGSFRRRCIQGVSSSSDVIPSLRYLRLQALIPLLVHPREARSAPVIGLGTGITSGALLTDRKLERRLCVELLAPVVEAAPLFRGNFSAGTDPSLEIRIADGRHELMRNQELFDLITLEPPPVVAAPGEKARIETSYQRLFDLYAISLLAYVGDREARAAEAMATKVRDFRQRGGPNACFDWFFGR